MLARIFWSLDTSRNRNSHGDVGSDCWTLRNRHDFESSAFGHVTEMRRVIRIVPGSGTTLETFLNLDMSLATLGLLRFTTFAVAPFSQLKASRVGDFSLHSWCISIFKMSSNALLQYHALQPSRHYTARSIYSDNPTSQRRLEQHEPHQHLTAYCAGGGGVGRGHHYQYHFTDHDIAHRWGVVAAALDHILPPHGE